MRELSLSPLTTLPCSPLQHIDAALEAGFTSVGLRLFPVLDTDIAVMESPTLQNSIAAHVHGSGVRVLDVEVVRVNPGTDAEQLRPALEFAGSLGARWFAVTSDGRDQYRPEDEPRLARAVERVADVAAVYNVGVMLEFMAYRGIATLADAVRIIDTVDRPNVKVCLDVLHLFRSGGSVASIAGTDTRHIACIQLNDAPAQAPADIAYEARYDRLLPGTGGLPVAELLAVLPPDLPASVEAPSRSNDRDPLSRAVAAFDSTRRLTGV